MISSMALGPR